VTRLPITVLVLTLNEELAIENCLKSVENFDQVIVVDSNSTDRTGEIARGLGMDVVNFSWNGKYPKKKQWALELRQIRNDWVLFLDADEIVTENLLNEIQTFVLGLNQESFAAVEIPLEYYFLQSRLRHGHKVKKIALVNRHKAQFPVIDDLSVTNMWEVEGHYQPIFDGRLKRMKSPLKHLDPDDLYDYFARHNRYSDWEAEVGVNQELAISVRRNRTRQGRVYDRLPCKPFAFFLYSFILRGGWLDGAAGFNYAVALSFYYWQISVKRKERVKRAKTF
jgi:glycosyltransferase involved in cell wall biosynthesis